MTNKTVHIQDITGEPKRLASVIATQHQNYKSARSGWEAEQKELRNFLFATDTTKTTNSSLPWKNKTTLPKLTQIRDNLHANYMAALFPHEDWLEWTAVDADAASKDKSKTIKAYMKNKLEQSKFRSEVSKLVYDYIDYGNCFAEVVHVEEFTEVDGEKIPVYIGPKLKRISPLDIVFDLTASEFKSAPKITRRVVSLGELRKIQSTEVSKAGWIDDAFNSVFENRRAVLQSSTEETLKADGFAVDGFGSIYQYYNSGLVELLEFEGDIYDEDSDTLLENHRIIIADRHHVLYSQPYNSWLGRSNKEHVGWRQRPDNLMAQGPLANLVGMQYRIDHLENLKADVFDQIAVPVVYQRGEVEPWAWGPGEKIFGDIDSEVSVLRPDSTALNADMGIQLLMNHMEELAGAPRQAMGIRTPGEKTALEVQTLENASGRIFQNKITYFEENFLEPLLNQMLEAGRRNMLEPTTISIADPDFAVQDFATISQKDITGKGYLTPRGARHYARKAQLVQNLVQLYNSALANDEEVRNHISSVKLAHIVEELLDLDRFDLVDENVRVFERAELAKAQNVINQQVQEEAETIPEEVAQAEMGEIPL